MPNSIFTETVSHTFSEILVLKKVYYIFKKYWLFDNFFCFSESGIIASSLD